MERLEIFKKCIRSQDLGEKSIEKILTIFKNEDPFDANHDPIIAVIFSIIKSCSDEEEMNNEFSYFIDQLTRAKEAIKK